MVNNRIFVTGSDGMLGSGLKEVFGFKENIRYFTRSDFDFTNKENISQFFSLFKNDDILIHCACFTNVNESEFKENRKLLNSTNVDSLKIISDECNKKKIKIIYPQTFLILDSNISIHDDQSRNYDPLSAYSKSKLKAENLLKNNVESNLLKIIRFGGFYGGGREIDKNFVGLFLNKILPNAKKDKLNSISVGNRIWQPTWTRDAANAIKIILNESGNYFQYCCNNKTSFSNLSKTILDFIGETKISINEIDSSKIIESAKRPKQIVMKSSKLFYDHKLVYDFSISLKNYLKDFYQ